MFLGYEHTEPSEATNRYDAFAEFAPSTDTTTKTSTATPRISYYSYPNVDRVHRYDQREDSTRNKSHKFNVFIGEIPRLLPTPYLAWCIDTLLGTYAVRSIHRHALNSAKLWIREETDINTICSQLNHRVKFDICGMWVAENAEGEQIMRDYEKKQSTPDTSHAYHVHLPQGRMVVDRILSQPQSQRSDTQPTAIHPAHAGRSGFAHPAIAHAAQPGGPVPFTSPQPNNNTTRPYPWK